MTLYKKLILTFTLAAGLSALPNAFAAPVAKPKPTPIRQGSTIHGEDKIDVLAAAAPPPAPGKQRTTTPAPSPTPTRVQNHGLDSIDVLAAFKPPVTTPGPGPKPNTTKTGGQNQEQDSTIV